MRKLQEGGKLWESEREKIHADHKGTADSARIQSLKDANMEALRIAGEEAKRALAKISETEDRACSMGKKATRTA